MSTTSTVVDVKDALLTLWAAALTGAGASSQDVPVTYAWPGAEVEPEAVFFGRHPDLDDIRVDGEQEIPTVKGGRKQRHEQYRLTVTIWQFRPDLDPSAARACEAQAFVIKGLLEDVLADDPRVGLDPSTLLHVITEDWSSTLFPFVKGWACELLLTLRVEARLT